MKIYLILGLLLVCGITFLPLTGESQKDKGAIRGEQGGTTGSYGDQSSGSGGLTSPGYIKRNAPDGGQFVIHPGSKQLQNPLDRYQATHEVENYLRSTGNPSLKLGDIREKGENFEADILTKDNSLVDKIIVNKNTGEMRSEY